LICSFLPCLSWLLCSRVRKSRRDLWITLYIRIYLWCTDPWTLNFLWPTVVRIATHPCDRRTRACCGVLQLSSASSDSGATWPRREHGTLRDYVDASGCDVAATHDCSLQQARDSHCRELSTLHVSPHLYVSSSFVLSCHCLSRFHKMDMRTIASYAFPSIPQFQSLIKEPVIHSSTVKCPKHQTLS